MKHMHDSTVVRVRRAWTYTRLGLVLVVVAGTSTARAASLQSTISSKVTSAIHSLTSSTKSSATPSSDQIASLNKFLKGGPNLWSIEAPYPIPTGLKSDVVSSSGTLKNTPLAQYLVWKRDQAPTYFDKHHPGLAPAMQQNDLLRQQAEFQAVANLLTQATQNSSAKVTSASTAATSTSSTSTGVSSTGTTTTAAQTLKVAAQVMATPAPEPASVASTLLLFGGAAAWWARRRRTRA